MTDGVMELLAKTSTLSDCTFIMSILADCTVNVLLSRPTDAVTEPVVILDKFNPTIADAGISNRLAPEPENDPLIKNRDPVIDAGPTKLKDPVMSAEPV